MTTSDNKPIDLPLQPSPHAHWLGWAALALATAALVLTFLNDPYWLALPCDAAGAAAGFICLRRGHDKHAAAHIGLNLALLNPFFWILLILLVPHLLGYPATSLFSIPTAP